MSTPQNNQLFVLRHLKSQEYVCFCHRGHDFYLYPYPVAALIFNSTDDAVTTDVFDKSNWSNEHFPSTLEFEVVELLMAPNPVIIRQ